MIDYKKMLGFCSKYDLDADELFLLYSLYIKEEQQFPEIHGEIKSYFTKHMSNRYVDKVIKLEERGLLQFLKPIEDKNKVDFKNLKITDKFINLLFVSNKDEIFQRVHGMYPQKGVSPDGYSYFSPANLIKSGNKEYFEKEVLKGMNKFDVDEMLYNISEMFDIDANGKAQNFAKVGFDTFIHNIHEIIRQWKEEQNSNSGSWNSKVY